MDEVAALTPTFEGVSFDFLDRVGSVQWRSIRTTPRPAPAAQRSKWQHEFEERAAKQAIVETG